MSEPLWQPRTDRAARLLGAGFFAGCGALLAYQGKVILDAVATGAERVSFLPAAIALGEAGALFGIFLIVRGLAGYQAVRALQTNPRGMRAFFIVSFVVIAASVFGIQHWLSSLGYD